MAIISTEIQTNRVKLKREREYWMKRLSLEMGRSNLTPDYARPKDYPAVKDAVEMRLYGSLYRRLTQLTDNSPFLLYTTLMTALKVCLHKYTANETVVIGSPALRELDERNALAIVDEVDGRASFRQLLFNVRESLLEAYARQQYPFHRLVEDLKLKNSEHQCPLFDVALILDEIHGELPDVRNDLTITLKRGADEVFGLFEFNSRLFKKESVERFKDHFVNLLAAALEKIEAPINTLPLMTEGERQQVLSIWNQTSTSFDAPHSTLHQLFLAQVRRSPLARALSDDSSHLSYTQLNESANQLSHLLLRLKLALSAPVAILMDRSPEMVISLLAVLKSGAAYLPLDPSYPAQRLQFMLEDAGVRLLLTQHALHESAHLKQFWEAAESGAVTVISVDERWAEISRESTAEVEVEVSSQQLAYVIYTSGSTGRPKGVMISHHAICNRLLWMQQEFPLTAQDRVLQKTPFSFDVSVWEFFWPLMTGATLVLARPGGHQESAYLVEVIGSQQISVLHFVPSMLEVFLEEEQLAEHCRSLRQVMCSGEALSVELAERFERTLPAPLCNLYGPTEAAIDVTFWQCRPQEHRRSIPIGHPIANTRIYILDGQAEPTPIGVSGELHIGGAGLARGYLGRAELTAEKFIPDRYGCEQGARLYRTGDVGRWTEAGEIEYVGRRDEQVKVRGYRIELGEVEAVARQQEGVREAVVVVREDEGGEKRLVCYVVWERAGGGARGQELKQRMRERLPQYMVPGVVIEVEQMPRQPNGKVDRKRLVEGEAIESGSEAGAEGARTPVEEIVTQIWREVLGVERIGVHDNFFDLGGHSLMTIKIVSRIRKTFKVELPIRNMFEQPTVASQARQIESVYRAGQEDQTPKLRPVPRDSPLALSYAQQRLWLIDQLESATVGYNIPAAVRLTGRLDVGALEQSLNELASRHETLRTTFASTDGQPVQIIAPVLNLKISVSDLQELPLPERDAELQRLLIEGAQESLDLARGPLIRAALFRLGPEEHVFLIVMHHIVSDGWSISILVNELAQLYEALSKGQPSTLSPLPIQYADFAQWQREWLQGEVLASQLAYWKKQLGGGLPVLKLPTDRPRTEVQTFRGATQYRVLDESLSVALRKLGRREGATLFMTLLTVFKILLHRYTGQEEITVGTNVASRNWLDTEGLIGFFVNELVLHTPLSGNPTFKELLGRVREVTLGAYAHQDVPFDKLVYALMPERNLSRAPLFQVLVDLQNDPMPSLKLTGLTISPVDINFGAAYFDLTLLMIDADNHLSTALHYKTDLFEPATITRMLENFERLLRLVVAEPDVRLTGLLSMLADAEKQHRLVKQKESKAANLQDLKKLRRRASDG